MQREIAVLRRASHPGIARLVASFRWREGAYLVLEYAKFGDLHSQVRTALRGDVSNPVTRVHFAPCLLQVTRRGSLDLESTRFIVGEVVSALASVHEAGCVLRGSWLASGGCGGAGAHPVLTRDVGRQVCVWGLEA